MNLPNRNGYRDRFRACLTSLSTGTKSSCKSPQIPRVRTKPCLCRLSVLRNLHCVLESFCYTHALAMDELVTIKHLHWKKLTLKLYFEWIIIILLLLKQVTFMILKHIHHSETWRHVCIVSETSGKKKLKQIPDYD